MAFEISPPPKIMLSDIMAQQNLKRGLKPLEIDPDLLLARINEGGHSGHYLAQAYFSTYRNQPFNQSLYDLVKLDAEGFRLFHSVIHMRHVRGWDDNALHEIEQKIISILTGEKS